MGKMCYRWYRLVNIHSNCGKAASRSWLEVASTARCSLDKCGLRSTDVENKMRTLGRNCGRSSDAIGVYQKRMNITIDRVYPAWKIGSQVFCGGGVCGEGGLLLQDLLVIERFWRRVDVIVKLQLLAFALDPHASSC